jgi:hypothetical protein
VVEVTGDRPVRALPRDEHQVTFSGLSDGSVEWTCRCGAGEVAVSPAAAEAEADAHAPRDEQHHGWSK